jgi:hypothetical protein
LRGIFSLPPAARVFSAIVAGWVDRERRTGQLVRDCYAHYLDGTPSADKIHALCRLTWITKSGDHDTKLPDNTPSVVGGGPNHLDQKQRRLRWGLLLLLLLFTHKW